MTVDYFGYLDRKEGYVFDGVTVWPIEDFDEARKLVRQDLNVDGFVYPPMQKNTIVDPLTLKHVEDVPNTARPALLHRLPTSHKIELVSDLSIEELRRGPSAFVMHLLGFFTGYRLQFYNWWLDGRVPINMSNGIHIYQHIIEDLLSHCFAVWKSWSTENQKLMTNLLYMFTRSKHYEWTWECFTANYMVIDGLWELHRRLNGVKNDHTPHRERIKNLCQYYEVPINDTHLARIVSLRNRLFHEALWDNGQPCSAGSEDSHLMPLFLQNIIMRLVPAMFNYKTSFINTGWWFMGQCFFDKAE